MPALRRTPKRREKSGLTKAIRERLIHGHWFSFLAGPGEVEPDKETLYALWQEHWQSIFAECERPWASRVFDEDEPWPPKFNQRDWITSKADERAVENGCYFDWLSGDRVVKFFHRYLRHSIGEFAGKPFEPMPFQRDDILMPLFGWKRADGTRRFRRALIFVPKKNGKSAKCSGISLYLLVGDDEPGAHVFNAASDRDQAGIVFDEAVNMVKASPNLNACLKITPSKKKISHPATNSFYRALSADVPTAEGRNIHGLIFDELHAQKTRTMFDTLRYGGAARKQPLQVSITTAGYDKNSVCYEEYTRGKKVLSGEIEDDAFFAYIKEYVPNDKLKHDEGWKNPKNHEKANPAWGVLINPVEFAEACREAQDSPTKENSFRRYRLNQWTDVESRWIKSEKWEACATPIDINSLVGKTCYAGLDMSSTTDLTAFVMVFPVEGFFDIVPIIFIPEENALQRERRDRVPYVTWERQGYIEFTPGNVIDQDYIRERINELGEVYEIKEIAVDRWNSTHLQVQLAGDGFTVIQFGQGFASMSGPTKEFEKLVLTGKIRHGGHPVLTWCVSNLVVQTDAAENLKPDKERSPERIDAAVAAIMGLGRCLVNDSDEGDLPQFGVY